MQQQYQFFKFCFLFFAVLLSFFSCKKSTVLELKKGLIIRESVTIVPNIYKLNGYEKSDSAIIIIEGENIVVDFQGATLKGSNDKEFPDEYYGIGIEVNGKNIEIKNLNIQGYDIGLKAFETTNFEITNSNFTYMKRLRLNPIGRSEKSKGSQHSLMKNKRVNGSAIVLEGCKKTTITNSKISHNTQGITIYNCEGSKIYNNDITYNTGHGIKLDRSSNQIIMHNYLDWNIIGNGFFMQKENTPSWNASGIHVFTDGKENIFAHNSITHCSNNDFGVGKIFENDFFPFSIDSAEFNFKEVSPLPDGQKTDSLKYKYRGQQYILINEWGPYNFEYPAIWIREKNEDKITFAIFGPEGNWKIVDGKGFTQTSRQSGSTPATIVATREKNYEGELKLDLEFIGVEFIDQFGGKNKRGKVFPFGFNE